MRSLKKNGKYNLQKLKKDALGSLTAVGWIFPLALAFGSNSPFGAVAGFVGAIVACLIGSGSPNRIPTPHTEVFAILIYAANTIGVPGAMLSCIIAGMLLLFVATIQFNKSFFKIPPAALGAVTFVVAAVLCIIQVNYYFGIGVPAGSAFETLVAYRSYGFHANWRGVLYGTITLVVMITYPIKFKNLSRKVPAPAVALVLTTVLNLILNPVAERTAIDEVGSFVSTPGFLLIGDISIFDVTPDKLLPSFIYAWALVVVLVADTLMKENRVSAVRSSLASKGVRTIICPICDGMIVGDEDSEGETRMTGFFAALIIAVLAALAHPVITRVPTATLAVIIICTAWKKIRFKVIKTAFKSNKKMFAIPLFVAMVVVGIFWDMVVVIDIVSIGTLIYCFERRRKVRKKAERLAVLREKSE